MRVRSPAPPGWMEPCRGAVTPQDIADDRRCQRENVVCAAARSISPIARDARPEGLSTAPPTTNRTCLSTANCW